MQHTRHRFEDDALATVRYPSNNAGGLGETVTYGYVGSTGEVESMSGTDDYVEDTDYRAAGMVTSMTHLTGTAELNRSNIFQASTLYLTWTQAGTGASTNNVHQYAFNYDSFGRVTSLRDNKNANQYQCYAYNQWNRLKTAFTTGDSACGAYNSAVGADPFNHTYNYSTIGNLASMPGVGTITYSTAHKHQATSAGSNTYTYDDAGNMVTRTIAAQTTQNLVWDESSRLEQITQGATTTGYLYDADGNRVARRDNGVTTVQIDNMFEWSSAGGLVTYYSHAGEMIAMRDDTGLNGIFGDHLGSNSTVRTAAGTNLRQRYQPYGRLRGSATLPTEYGYTGQRLDPTGLMDYNARQYDPLLGRFTSPDTIIPDPADPQAFNRYTYVNNNPVNFTDPTGHEPCAGGELGGCNAGAVEEAREGVNGGSGGGGHNPGADTDPEDRNERLRMLFEFNEGVGTYAAGVQIGAGGCALGAMGVGAVPIALECGAVSATAGVVGNVSDLLAVADACIIKATDSDCGLATASLIAPYWSKAMTDAAVETAQAVARTGESLVTSAEKAAYAVETFWNSVTITLGLREEDE